MSYTLELDEKPAYLHAVVTGENSRENVVLYLTEILRECLSRGCCRLLVEERLEGPRLGTLDVFAAASAGSSGAAVTLKMIAYVDVNSEGNLMRFAQTVAVNRGVRVRVFPTVSEAAQWLLEEDGGMNERSEEADRVSKE